MTTVWIAVRYSYISITFSHIWQGFSTVTSNWLAAMVPVIQKLAFNSLYLHRYKHVVFTRGALLNVTYTLKMECPMLCKSPGLNNSIGPIARNCRRATVFASEVACQTCVVEYSGNPFFLYQTTAQYPLTMALKNDFRIEQHLCWFCPWSHIHCVQFIVYMDHIIIVLVPFLKYWWRSSKSTTVSQMVRKTDITTLRPCISNPMVINIEQHY